jgi:hypothetical protein
MSNYRQWGVVASLYVGYENRDKLPSFSIPPTSGHNAWDVSLDVIPQLAPYGLTIPMWFCPVRPDEFNNANDRFSSFYDRPIPVKRT